MYVGSLGGFVFGYDLGALSAVTEGLRAQFNLFPWAFGLTIASSVWGTVCGSILAGRLADKSDLRNLIALCSILYTIAAVGVTLPASSEWLYILAMRFLCGVAVGGFTVGCPLYLSEIAPVKVRGRVVGLFQVQVGIGVIVAFAVGAISAHRPASSAAWKWVFGLGAVPALALFLLVRYMPPAESNSSDGDRGKNPSSMRSSSVYQAHSMNQKLFCGGNTRLLLVATSIAIFNQLSGVNILLLYMLEILASAGMSFSLGHTYTVLISCLSLATTLAGMAFVDQLGRKPLLYIGSAGMALCLLMLGLAIPYRFAPVLYVSILGTYNAFFSFSQGTVVWVYLSELFPPGLRGPWPRVWCSSALDCQCTADLHLPKCATCFNRPNFLYLRYYDGHPDCCCSVLVSRDEWDHSWMVITAEDVGKRRLR